MKNFKRKAVVSLANLAILGGGFAGSVGVFADSLDTPVRVQFDAENHIPNPNPDPDVLQLRFVPNLVDFGNTHTAGTAVSQSIDTTGKYVALYDGRDTANNEWTLSASASNLVNPTAPTQTITSGDIKVSVGTMKNWTAPSEPSATNTTTNATNITVGSDVTAGNVEVPLNGTSVELAKTNAGLQDHGYALPINSMELELAAADTTSDFAGQTFTGNITWALTDSF